MLMNEYEVKYDYDLDLNSKNSLKLFNDRIKDNSVVLEFGPANGRLTRYLHTYRGCTVDIVEINPVSGAEAAQYARKSLIGENDGNIENYHWLDVLKNEKYDYILFADVLEHLYNPEMVLKECSKILKKDGSIILSTPNISNNNIILSLLKDEFNYTSTGLLDDTHIHFFTYNSINNMIKKLGYSAVYIDWIDGSVGKTEIKVNYDDFSEYNTDIIKDHIIGNVYQFIYEIKLGDCDPNKIINNVKKLYLDNLFIEYEPHWVINDVYTDSTNLKVLDVEYSEQTLMATYDFSNNRPFNGIRFDPLEGIFCSCEIISIDTDAKFCKVSNTNANSIDGNKYTFFTTDPIINFNGDFSKAKFMTITYKLRVFNMIELTDIIKKISKDILELNLEKNNAVAEKNNAVAEKNNAVAEKNNAVAERNSAVAERNSAVAERNSAVAEKNNMVLEMNRAIAEKNNCMLELNNIKSTKGYKFMEKIRKIIK
jgi:SAM-dependent methyltransferase